MKAIRIHKHGPSDVLTIDDLPVPKPKAGEVLIKVKAAALNHLDIFVRKGFAGLSLPLTMGSDAAGEVVETGENVTWLKKGDEVIQVPFRVNPDDPLLKSNNENLSETYQIPGEHTNGVQAEYICIPDIYALPKPLHTSWQEAAAFPLVALTAYHMLCRKVTVKKDHWVLIYGASSGVGSIAIQIAKSLGAHVITTAGSAEKARQAKAIGADHVINYEKQTVGKTVKEISGAGVDIVIEHTGELTWKDSLRSLKPGGKIVCCGATTGFHAPIDLRALFTKQQHIIGSTMGTFKDMVEVISLVNSGRIKPLVSKSFNYKKVNLAHEYLESGKHFGKVVLEFDT